MVSPEARRREDHLRQAIERTHAGYRDGLGSPFIQDLAFPGNTGGWYPWDPCAIIDIDVCVLVTRMDSTSGQWLLERHRAIREALRPLGVDFVPKIVRGPYRVRPERPDQLVAFAHLAVFTEEAYRHAPKMLRWCWRKYRCVVEPGRLRRLSPPGPDPAELIAAVDRKLGRIREGRVYMTERSLPDFTSVQLAFGPDDPEFTEYCLSAAMNGARNHARALRCRQADVLPNEAFFPWYHENLLASAALAGLIDAKNRARDGRLGRGRASVRALAVEYLETLAERLPRDVGAD